MTEKEKMITGENYNCMDDELIKDRIIAKQTCQKFNNSDPADWDKAMIILKQVLGKTGEFFVETGFQCTYGYNINLGENFFANYGCVILDMNRVEIGNHVMMGPGVHIYTAIHPTEVNARNSGIENSEPVFIGNNVWIGGSVVICPGVHIGNNTTIGAGSVIVNDIPDNVVAVGNPGKVIKNLPHD